MPRQLAASFAVVMIAASSSQSSVRREHRLTHEVVHSAGRTEINEFEVAELRNFAESGLLDAREAEKLELLLVNAPTLPNDVSGPRLLSVDRGVAKLKKQLERLPIAELRSLSPGAKMAALNSLIDGAPPIIEEDW